MGNELNAAIIFFAGQARKALKAFWQNEQNEQAHLNRHVYVAQLQSYAHSIDAEKFPQLVLEIKAALQHNPDQRHWSEWDKPRREDDYRPDQHEGLLALAWAKMEQLEQAILQATGMERQQLIYQLKNVRQAIFEQGYITLMPEDYVEYPDGEKLGYDELRYLLSIMEDEVMESPYKTDEENRMFRQANAERFAPEPMDSDLFEEDRGYEPPTFTPALELDFNDITKFLLDQDSSVKVLTQNILADDIRLDGLFTGSYLTNAERYFALKRIVSDVCQIAHNQGKKVYFEPTLDELAEQAGLNEFIELYDEELSNRDPGDWYGQTSDNDIVEMADHVIDQIVEAPVVSIPVPEIQRLWAANKHQFPAQEKVISWRANGKAHFRLKDEADYQTLGKLYRLVGLNLDGRLLHGHTPFYQRGVIERIAAGASISEAYRLTRQDYLAYRHRCVFV